MTTPTPEQLEQLIAEADEKAVPDEAVPIGSRDEAPEGAQVIEGEQGGLYYVPAGEGDGDGEADGEGDGEADGEDDSGGGTAEAHDEVDPDIAEQVGESWPYDPDSVTETGEYGDMNYAVTDTWDYGGQWDFWNESETMVVSQDTWDDYSPEARDYLMEHERAERAAAEAAGYTPGEDNPADVVDDHHSEANQEALEEHGEEAARVYAQESYEHELEGEDPEKARGSAAYMLRGILEDVDIDIDGEPLTPDDIPPELQESDG